MLGRIGAWRHLLVALAIVGVAVLALVGVIGGGNRGERFDAKQVLVTPVGAGSDGIRIREVVDQDFGAHDRHGYQRIVPNDFGVPMEITASSPDAPDDLDVADLGDRTRIRIGDPDTTVSGQHRYVLSYTLPSAMVTTGRLALDIIGDPDDPEQLETGLFEVVVAGMELADTRCNAGAFGTSGGCTLERVDAEGGGTVYRAVISPLEPGEGITIGGTIVSVGETADVPVPPLPDRRDDRRVLLAAIVVPLGVLAAAGVFLRSRRLGRNEVFAGGAADAAYGELPGPSADGTTASAPTVLVADDQMDELATIEFVPPKGIEPWQGAVLLRERIDDDTVAAWFSGLAAKEAITLADDDDDHLVIGWGPRRNELDRRDAAHIEHFMDGRDTYELGKYDAEFARTWRDVRGEQEDAIAASGWWKRMPPTATFGSHSGLVFVGIAAAIVFGFGSVLTALIGLITNFWVALVFGVLVPAVIAVVVYRSLLRVRSATGSALALRTESFRRFLDSSEGQHVEWAWSHGRLREYSAWAVALGAADAWNEALSRANVPPEARAYTAPLLVHSMGSSIASTRTAPSSSGGGGGGFSGGSVGGGGGGGSSGSW